MIYYIGGIDFHFYFYLFFSFYRKEILDKSKIVDRPKPSILKKNSIRLVKLVHIISINLDFRLDRQMNIYFLINW